MLENFLLNSMSLAKVFSDLLGVALFLFSATLLVYNIFYDIRRKKCPNRSNHGLTPMRFSVISLSVHILLILICMIIVHLNYNAPYEFPDTEHKIEIIDRNLFETSVEELVLIDSYYDESHTCTDLYIYPDNETEVYVHKYYKGEQRPMSVFISSGYKYKEEIHWGNYWEKNITEGSVSKTLENTDEIFMHLVNMDSCTYIDTTIWWMDYIPETYYEARADWVDEVVPYSEKNHVIDVCSDTFFFNGIHGEDEETIRVDNPNISMYSTEPIEIPETGYYIVMIISALIMLVAACWWAK